MSEIGQSFGLGVSSHAYTDIPGSVAFVVIRTVCGSGARSLAGEMNTIPVALVPCCRRVCSSVRISAQVRVLIR